MVTLLLVLFIFAGVVSAGAVISACALAGRIDSDQEAIANGHPASWTDRVEKTDVSVAERSRAPALTA